MRRRDERTSKPSNIGYRPVDLPPLPPPLESTSTGDVDNDKVEGDFNGKLTILLPQAELLVLSSLLHFLRRNA